MNLLHPGLARLIKLRARSRIRILKRTAGTVRGRLYAAVAIALVGLWAAALAFTHLAPMDSPHDARRRAIEDMGTDNARTAASLFMLAFFVLNQLSPGGRALLNFHASEVDFLFPGPFSRRQLLTYKFLLVILQAMGGALFLSLILLPSTPFWSATFIALTLAFIYIQLLSAAWRLMRQGGGAPRLQTGPWPLIIVGGLAGLYVANQTGGLDGAAAAEGFSWIIEAPLVRAVMLPFLPFAAILFPGQWFPHMWLYAAGGAALNGAIFAGICYSNADFLEESTAASAQLQQRVRRLRQGRFFTPAQGGNQLRIPMPPRLGGIGPMAWRQSLTALRSLRTVLVTGTGLTAIIAAGLLVTGMAAEFLTWPFASAIAALLTFYSLMLFRFDFRTDLDNMAWLRALPLRPAALAAGQILPTALMTVYFPALILVITAAYQQNWPVLALIIAALPLASYTLVAFENLLFLLLPTRAVAHGAMDLQYIGRTYVLVFVRMLVMGFALAIAGGVGAASFALSGGLWPMFWLGLLAALTLEAISLTCAVGHIFSHFDPSRDMPE